MNTKNFYIFVADWCPHCRAAKSAIFELVDKYHSNGNIILVEDSSEEYKELSQKLSIDGLPAFVVLDEVEKVITTYEFNDRSFEALLGFYAENTGTAVLEEDQPIYNK